MPNYAFVIKLQWLITNTDNVVIYSTLSCVNCGTFWYFGFLSARVLEPEPLGARVFGWSQSRHFAPAPAPPLIFV